MIDDTTLAAWERDHAPCSWALPEEPCRFCAALREIRRLREEPLDFTGHDHPKANGQRPQPGVFEWTFSFTLEDGRTLKVHVGERGFRAYEEMFLKNRDADYQQRDVLIAAVAAHQAVVRELVDLLMATRARWNLEIPGYEQALTHPLVVAARK